MKTKTLVFLKLVLVCFERVSAGMTSDMCDMATTGRVHEGNIGQSGVFNWIGVLRVHLHDGDSVQVAMTGIVLIKMKYAIGNADDIVRIPQRVFLTDSQAMFIAARDTPWFVQPKSYVNHPEYEYATTNTIAVIELNIDEVDTYPLMPICLPSLLYNTSTHLYLTGFTDENKFLEKVVYKIHYLQEAACEEFYNRAGLSTKNRAPSSYICGYSPFNKTQCVWDNGMALISNATGWFYLIGFGIRGPGCAAPARFINIHPYLSWISSVTTQQDEMYDSPDYRRQDSNEYIPTHELFKSQRRQDEEGMNITDDNLHREYVPYPFDVDKPKHFNIEPFDDGKNVAVFPFNDTWQWYENACSTGRIQLYREQFELHAENGKAGTVTYKISLFSLLHKICVCVIVRIESVRHDECFLSFKEAFSFDEGTQIGESGETPEEVFRYYPINKVKYPRKNDSKWVPNAQLQPKILKQGVRFGKVLNYDLYIKLDFVERAVIKFEMYSATEMPSTTPSSLAMFTRQPAPKRKYGFWGAKINVDKRVKEPTVSVALEHEEVQETVSEGCLTSGGIVFVSIILLFYLSDFVLERFLFI